MVGGQIMVSFDRDLHCWTDTPDFPTVSSAFVYFALLACDNLPCHRPRLRPRVTVQTSKATKSGFVAQHIWISQTFCAAIRLVLPTLAFAELYLASKVCFYALRGSIARFQNHSF